MENFFERLTSGPHPWPAKRHDLHWHLLPTVAEARTLTERYRPLTHWPGLEEVPPQWLHVSVLHSVPTQEATADDIHAITNRVRAAVTGMKPVQLTFSRPTITDTTVECAARPADAARALRHATWTATEEAVGDRRRLMPHANDYHPHTTLAYVGPNTQTLNRNTLQQILNRIEGEETTFTFPTLSLVSQWHDNRRIVWSHLADICLTGTTETATQELPAASR